MDPNVPKNNNTTKQYWTNEKHLHFLKSMEASFVRTMLENNSLVLRLDRYLPDSSDSTRDLKSQRRKKHGTPVGPSRTRMEGGVDKRSTRRFSSHHKHYDPSQDQVVPQLENGSSGDQDENNLPNIVAIAPPMAPAN
ncbi:hypothetical protein NC652_030275 [Populus alba x Populus x berolinensis]|uniref:Uncharacterized protein n=1 Tax=Populus tomentosa TaxID=118781 RepID=A0A8X8CHH0_POPTO|nr:hypothetical protein POTOM_042529 [Populus tomentosa]KAJ6889449.1 hypothetical protein NC652_030275 [Populus alba x Populus x berolinensis]